MAKKLRESHTYIVPVAVAALFGCTGVVDSEGPMPGGVAGSGGGGMTKPQNQDPTCEGWDVAMPQRVIRLSFNQVATSLVPVFGQEFAAKIVADNSIKDPTERTFPPLGDTDEGSSYIDAKWQTADAIAKAAGAQALASFGTFTGCGDAPTTECAQAFVASLAERAFRRPLTEREKTSLLTVYSDVIARGSTIQVATQQSVHAIFLSPHFLYRTELGAQLGVEGPITPYELASQLSYFVTDGPPDAELLMAAAQNQLSTPEQIGPHVDRMLASPAARVNLESAMVASLGVSKVLSVVIDPAKVPEFNAGLAASMFRETQLFISNVLWNGGRVSDLVTSRQSYISASMAPLYGVAAPVMVDADGFGLVELPENRAGVLTSLAFLSSRSRPDMPSVVGRGLAVNEAILCQQNPAFPESLTAQIGEVEAMQHELTERERADYRAATLPCSSCHVSFDPFGIALENFDTIGRFRTVDDHQKPINASVTLPASAGGGVAQNAVEMGQALATSGAFSACAATKLLTYALAETGVKGNSCATKAVAERFKATDQSFAALVREVAISKTLTHRSGG
jgi:hypothetical protein